MLNVSSQRTPHCRTIKTSPAFCGPLTRSATGHSRHWLGNWTKKKNKIKNTNNAATAGIAKRTAPKVHPKAKTAHLCVVQRNTGGGFKWFTITQTHTTIDWLVDRSGMKREESNRNHNEKYGSEMKTLRDAQLDSTAGALYLLFKKNHVFFFFKKCYCFPLSTSCPPGQRSRGMDASSTPYNTVVYSGYITRPPIAPSHQAPCSPETHRQPGGPPSSPCTGGVD